MRKLMILAVIGAVSLTACGDSSSSSTPVEPDPTADVITVGTITRIGSVVSNGVEFSTSAAAVTLDDQPGQPAELRVGQVVAINGNVNLQDGKASARTIKFLDEVEGPIASISALQNSFMVLGRTIVFDELSVFDAAEADTIAVGNMVQVSGYWQSRNRIRATHVERIANAWTVGMPMEIKGEVNGLNEGLQRFTIGSQPCDYSAAMLELGNATLANGLYVEVTSTEALENGILKLDRIQARDRDQDQDRDRDHLCIDGCEFDLEGYVTEFVSASEFTVDGAPVTTTGSTIYVNGTVESLAVDVKVAIRGVLDETGVLVADRIVIRLPSVLEIRADIEALDIDTASVTVLGIDVTTNDWTLFRDDSDADIYEFWLDDLAIGDRVEIRAYLEDSTVVATRLERDNPSGEVTLKAPVESIDRPSLTLLGVTASATEETVFQGADFQVIDADTFFETVALGSLVKAQGTYDGTSILADKLFLRVCQDACL